MHKRLKANSEDNNNDKALNRLASFFMTQNENVHFEQESVSVLVKNMPSGSVCSDDSTCFKMKIEHENLHRNKSKNKLLKP